MKGRSSSQGWQAGGGVRGRPLFNINGEEGANRYCGFEGGVREVREDLPARGQGCEEGSSWI